jgi:dTDP-4-dehydrorhamnose reductase
MRIAVTGRFGQIARSLVERGPSSNTEVLTLARPEVDLTRPHDLTDILAALRPQAVVSAAAYTAVDLAESEPVLAYQINANGAEALAQATARLKIPIVHLSTDYVFDGALDRPYCEDDPPCPINVYGLSKLRGEQLVAAANPNHVILRTAWVYSPFGKNFVRTMLSLAGTRDEISVVSDQRGSPSNALDIADGIFNVLCNLIARPDDAAIRGVFHMTGGGETNWAEFAMAIFAASATCNGPCSHVRAIASSAYPTAARRPANSRLDNSKLARSHGVRLPLWRDSVPETVSQILAEDFQKKGSA